MRTSTTWRPEYAFIGPLQWHFLYNIDLLFENKPQSRNHFIVFTSEIKGLRSSLSPVLSPQDITSETPVNLSATYECIDTPVHFEWFAVVSIYHLKHVSLILFLQFR